MSVTIHWRPVAKADKHFRTGTSSQLEVLKEVFGVQVKPEDVPTLRAMALASAAGSFYDEVADTVEQVGAISFWGSW